MKKITILNGIPDSRFQEFEKKLADMAERNSPALQIESFTLREMDIQYCCGCWSCWLKTPGLCPQKDEMPQVLKSVIQSDLTVFVSPVVMGFTSALLKKANDKMIPLIHPYIGIFGGECHHKKRYDKYPKLGLALLNTDCSPTFDSKIITDMYRRMAINFKTELAFSCLSDGNVEVIENEIYHI